MPASIKLGEINYVDLSPRDEICCICDKAFSLPYWQQSYGIPMYEGLPVPPEWSGEWGGFFACKECYDKYESGELQTWDAEQLAYSQAKANSYAA